MLNMWSTVDLLHSTTLTYGNIKRTNTNIGKRKTYLKTKYESISKKKNHTVTQFRQNQQTTKMSVN